MSEKINIRFTGDGEADAHQYEVDYDVNTLFNIMYGDRNINAIRALDHNGDEVFINVRAIEQVWPVKKKK